MRPLLRPGPTGTPVAARDHPRRRPWPRLPPSGSPARRGRPRAALAVPRPQGPQGDLHRPHRAASDRRHTASIPLPVDIARPPRGLYSPEPGARSPWPLVASTACRPGICAILLTDMRDGRLTVDGRDFPLADPVRVRLAAYLDYRTRRWPAHRSTRYLFVNRDRHRARHRSAARFPWHRSTCSPSRSARTASCTRPTPPAATSADLRPVRAQHRRRHALHGRSRAPPPRRRQRPGFEIPEGKR